jgi:mycothiol synthase
VAGVLDVFVHRPPAADDVETLHRLADEATARDGHPPFGDSVWRDLAHPTSETTVVTATDRTVAVGALHLGPPDNITGTRELLSGLVVAPDSRDGTVERTLLDAACSEVANRGGAHLVLWVFGADDASTRHAAAAGFELERELRQLRIALPLDETPRWPDGVAVDAFRRGVDDDEWLAVNNRAFADNPDQRGWTHETLASRLAEPWFDPGGFLVARDADGIAGFCWTKVHAPDPPREPGPLGEIYVIGVDPSRQGSGLGRALVVAGLAWLHEHGTPTGMLFVDAVNEPALALYDALGFEVARRDCAYARDIP